MQSINLDSEPSHALVKYRTHLEFAGHNIEEKEDSLVCRHPRKPTLFLRHIGDRGVLVSTYFIFDKSIKRTLLLEFANTLNTDFIFMKAYLDQENDLGLDTFFEGIYDRTNFSILLENIEYDLNILWKNSLTEHYLA
jgi:hypothetical protein